MRQNNCLEDNLNSQELSAGNCDLAEGYKVMSRINLSLAEEGVLSDNDALEICEQKLAECE